MDPPIKAIVDLLTQSAAAYYNGKTPLMDDESYDALLDTLKARDPENPFLTQVGAPPSACYSLPVRMPSLDKIKPGEDRLKRFLTSADQYVLSEKLDGLSALWIPSKTQLFLRGNGIEGYLIPSAMVPHIQGLVQSSENWIIRGELIMKRSKDLINGRNIVNGLLHHKTPDKNLLSKIEFIAYEVHNPTGLKRNEQFTWLKDHNFMVPWHTLVKMPTEALCSQEFMARRSDSLYDTDGIVVGINQCPIRTYNSGGPIQNPKDCVAFKMSVQEQSATTTIQEIIWAPSAQGYLIPRLRFEPVVIGGAKIEFCTGHNARTIVDKVLGPGAVVKIRRSGDVIPTLDDVLIPALVPSLPSPTLDWKWNGPSETATHLYITSVSEQQCAAQLYHFAKTLDIQGLGPASATALVEAGIKGPGVLWNSTEAMLCKTLGPKSGKTLYTNLRALQTNPSLSELTLILASNKIPRGTGEAKLNSLFKNVPDPRHWISTTSIPPGWTEETFSNFKTSFKDYETWRKNELFWIVYPIIPNIAVPSSSETMVLTKGTICFTGFRDKDLEQRLKSAGFVLAATMTNAVNILVTADEVVDSAKVAKARASKSVEVITRTAFVNKYLS